MSLLGPFTVVVEAAVLIAASGLLFEGLLRLLQGIARRAGARQTSLSAIRSVFGLLWLAVSVAGVVYLTNLASYFTLLTVSGIAGLIVSLALQAVLSNVIAGIFLLSDGAVRVGDTIEVGGVKGRVARFALRNTWIVTDSGSIAIVGNSSLMAGPLVNHSATARLQGRATPWP